MRPAADAEIARALAVLVDDDAALENRIEGLRHAMPAMTARDLFANTLPLRPPAVRLTFRGEFWQDPNSRANQTQAP